MRGDRRAENLVRHRTVVAPASCHCNLAYAMTGMTRNAPASSTTWRPAFLRRSSDGSSQGATSTSNADGTSIPRGRESAMPESGPAADRQSRSTTTTSDTYRRLTWRRHRVRRHRALTLVAALVAAGDAARPAAQTGGRQPSPRPKQFFGHNIGDDYFLATYDQFIGVLEEDRQGIEPHAGDRDRQDATRAGRTGGDHHRAGELRQARSLQADLAAARRGATALTDEQARALAKEGKAVVWIDGGLHATEVVGAHQLIETAYQLVSRTDEETMRILRDVIIAAVHANPDGMQMVVEVLHAEHGSTRDCSPRLYNKYAGHDDNRDLYIEP